ncbi:hypothetical protein ABB37_09366 [Leptomonas pyrrhocoris]|uniref:Uncharacterized protein n=1 Tax=Leptomonas pyrrhocoris TaxID=157538 RepID=A0A0M9FQQ6_LEPPY|nr:hypothetical protein ABB37_09366 [Leptomonas pyrrhocoris]KPA74063.1 hypothetical protein ABB37_09366 [Leptomonas pyrrhocoris]|eukprot:XP_015652502.1 hypothetical protein ABB37_09366 [Leptomonas pyrrhocoris]
MSSTRSLHVYEGEPYWSVCLREYVIPTFVFVLLVYYLVFCVLLPMRRINRPTRQPIEEVLAATADSSVTDSGSNAEEASPTEGKKDK